MPLEWPIERDKQRKAVFVGEKIPTEIDPRLAFRMKLAVEVAKGFSDSVLATRR